VTISIPVIPPSYTKRHYIELAFEECGLAGYEFERTAEEIGAALRKLNAMMDEHPWNTLGYVQSGYGNGLPTELSGIPRDVTNVVSMYLAMRIAPNFGITMLPESRAALARSFMLMQSQYAVVPSMLYDPRTARGMGNKPHDRPFVQQSYTDVDVNVDPGDLAGLLEAGLDG
jgi:hypothetical protein